MGGHLEQGSAVITPPPATTAPVFLPGGSTQPTATPIPTPTATPWRPGWTGIEGLPGATSLRALAVRGSALYAAGTGVVYQVRLPGSAASPGPQPTPASGLPAEDVQALAVAADWIYAGTAKGVYRKAAAGGTWDVFNDGIPTSSAPNYWIGSLLVDGAALLSGGSAAVFRTSEGGTWQELGSGIAAGTGTVASLASDASAYYAGAGDGTVYRLPRQGATWAALGDRLDFGRVTALAFADGKLYAAAGNAVKWTDPADGNWKATGSGLDGRAVYAFSVVGAKLYAGTGAGVFGLDSAADSWEPVGSGLEDDRALALVQSGSVLLAGIRSRDSGNDPGGWFLPLE